MQKENYANVGADSSQPRELPRLPAAEHGERVDRMFREHNESLLRFLRTRLHSAEEAREVAQEAYVQMLGLDNPAGPGFVQSYLFRTAANLSTARLTRSAARKREAQLVFFADEAQTRQSETGGGSERQRLDRVNKALSELPPLCRRAFILVRYEGMDFDAAAAELGLHPRKIRQFVQRAFASCQRALRNQAQGKAGTR